MVKLAYLECPTGIAGDMCLGALLDAGVPLEYLQQHLQQLGIAGEFTLRQERVQRNDQQGMKAVVELQTTKSQAQSTSEASTDQGHGHESHAPHGTSHHFHNHHTHEHGTHGEHTDHVHSHHTQSHAHSHATHSHDTHSHHTHSHHSHSHNASEQHVHDHLEHSHAPTRHLPEIEHMIRQANLPPRARDWSLAVFRKLAVAEGAVHGVPPEQVHFHEVGAVDAIVDIVGTCLGLDWLGIERIYCSALPTGGGTVRAAHGRLPVPVPAVLKLWQQHQVPVYSNGIERELVTPTGAAIAVTLSQSFGAPPAMQIHKIGLGAGSAELPLPNFLRLWVGESLPISASQAISNPALSTTEPDLETIVVLETQIDDLNPQAIGYAFEQLFAAGAVDVFTQGIGMKKSRPGVLLTVICHPEAVADCEQVLFRETSTLGIRRSLQQRTILPRQLEEVVTPYGKVGMKVARQGEAIINVQPEFEDCAQLARQYQLPWQQVHQMALGAWYELGRAEGK
jgi:pyridinium-3,5-bisthiocarboxylic acid mononucleotide nickel chelatase